MDKNICIIHYNTPVLTQCLIRSINKYTPDAKIYIFDNSDKEPFDGTFDNVTVFDNTHGELLDFDAVLQKYPLRVKSRGKTNNYGSAKHTMSVQKCIELINDNFILLDSDVLLRRDITPLYNEKYVWIAGVEEWCNKTLVNAKKRKRVCPFLMYVNVKKMNELGITFFDDEHMLGLNNGPKCEEYETGVWFYESTPKNLRRIINYVDYILHFRAGSWLEDARTKHRYKQMDPLKWLEKNKKYWLKNGETLDANWNKKRKTLTTVSAAEKIAVKKEDMTNRFKNIFDHIYCIHSLMEADKLTRTRKELKRVGIDENAPYFSWVYNYPSEILDLLYKVPELKMDTALKASGRDHLKRLSVRHYEIMKEAYALGYGRILIIEDDVLFHNDIDYISKMLDNMPDTDVVLFDKMTCSAEGENLRYKEYLKTLPEDALYGDMEGIFYIFTTCYSVNRDAMRRITERQENGLLPPDTPLNDSALTGSFAIENVAVKAPSAITRKSETYDKIGLKVDGNYGEPVIPGKPAPVKGGGLNKPIPKPRKTITVHPKKRVLEVVRPVSKPAVTRIEPVPNPKKNMPPQVKVKRVIVKGPERFRVRTTIPSASKGFNKLYDV